MKQNIGSKSGDKMKHKLEEWLQNETQVWGMAIRWNTKEQIFWQPSMDTKWETQF